MLKKGCAAVKFERPESAMRRVLMAIDCGDSYPREVQARTQLKPGQVYSALKNLVYIGAVVRARDSFGKSVYNIPGRMPFVSSTIWAGKRSVFDVSTAVDNQMVNTRKD